MTTKFRNDAEALFWDMTMSRMVSSVIRNDDIKKDSAQEYIAERLDLFAILADQMLELRRKREF